MASNQSNRSLKVIMISIILINFCVLTACSSSASAKKCAEFDTTIDQNIMEIAISEVGGAIEDNSAIQQGARLTQNNNRLSTIMINIQLQGQNKCFPRQQPIDTTIYALQAHVCYLARTKKLIASFGSDEKEKAVSKDAEQLACDFKSWNTNTEK